MAVPAKRAFLWLPVIVWMGVIFGFSFVSRKNMPGLSSYPDLLGHALLYAVLGLFVKRALRKGHPFLSPAACITFSVLFCVLYGITDELHQAFVPSRSAELSDLVHDAIGGLIGSLLYR